MRQISSLQKGLIFNPDPSEWGQGRDLVSGVIPTNTAVFPVLDKSGSGRRWLDFNGTSSYVALPTQPVFGTGDFTVIRRVKVGTIGAIRTLIGGAANSFELYISATGYLTVLKNGGSALTASTTLLTAGSIVSLGYSRSGTTGTYYIDGVAAGTCTDSNNYSVATTLGGNGTGFFNGSDVMNRCFNYALTPTQIINYSKPEYPIEFTDRIVGTPGAELIGDPSMDNTGWWGKGANTTITGGECVFNGTSSYIYKDALTIIGKRYKYSVKCNRWTSGAALSIGASASGTSSYSEITKTTGITTSAILTATGTQLGIGTRSFSADGAIDDVSVVQLGCILDLNAEGMASATWVDKTNSLTATNSGTTFVLPSASNLGAMYFNGSAKLAYTGMDGLTSDISFACSILPLTLSGRIFDNSKLLIYVNPSGYLTVSRDGTTLINSGAGSIAINTTYKVAVTSTSAGLTNIYINGVLSGTANQAAGTPASGTTWNLGNNAASNQAFTGRMKTPIVENRIMTLDEISLLNSIL